MRRRHPYIESLPTVIYIDIYKRSAICLISVGLTQLVLFLHSMFIIRECVGAIVGGAMVYGVGFRTMTAVRFIHGSGVYITLVYLMYDTGIPYIVHE